MILLASAPGWLAAILLFLLMLASFEDMWRMEISNWTGAAVAAGAFVALLLDGPATGLWQNLLLCVALLGAGTLLFRAGALGGGDVKLLAASALWFDLSSGVKLLCVIAVAGGAETLVLLGLRRLPWSEAVRRRALPLRPGEGIPYAVAIALGVALMSWWLRR